MWHVETCDIVTTTWYDNDFSYNNFCKQKKN